VGLRLYIPDYGNNRILGFNSIPGASNASADLVIGQSSMTVTTGGNTNQKLTLAWGKDYDATTGKFAIADYRKNRVHIYNSLPTTTNATADVVLGQTGFYLGSANRGGFASAPIFHINELV
jgi:hypothetical protein